MLKKALEDVLGCYLLHPMIRAEFGDLYRGDGVHLSEKNNNIFLEDLQQELQAALSHTVGTRQSLYLVSSRLVQQYKRLIG